MPSIAHQFVKFGSSSRSMYGKTRFRLGVAQLCCRYEYVSGSGNRYCDRPQYVGYLNIYVSIQEVCYVLI
jgi:hypothetical protein